VSPSDERRFSRRQVIAGGVAGGAVLVGGNYGRFALGDEFEEHVASVLGVPIAVAKELTRSARDRLGGEYDRLAAEFLAVTVFPSDLVAPRKARNRAVRRLLPSMIGDPAENLMYLGMRAPSDQRACAGLIRS
jgi:hypothetical protein